MHAWQLVAIDAEFVAVSKEVTRRSGGGKTVVVKPARLALARVSCLRGDGSLAGVPFIDSYIQQVVTPCNGLYAPLHGKVGWS